MKIFLIVDMQNDFINGALKNINAEAIVPKIKNKILEYEKSKEYNFYLTQDTHDEKVYPLTIEGQRIPKHCIRETPGWEINKEILSVLPSYSTFIEKESFGFDGWDGYSFLDVTEFQLCGVCTDICVISNALMLRSLFPKSKISVFKDLCAGTSINAHVAALSIMKNCGIDII